MTEYSSDVSPQFLNDSCEKIRPTLINRYKNRTKISKVCAQKQISVAVLGCQSNMLTAQLGWVLSFLNWNILCIDKKFWTLSFCEKNDCNIRPAVVSRQYSTIVFSLEKFHIPGMSNQAFLFYADKSLSFWRSPKCNWG